MPPYKRIKKEEVERMKVLYDKAKGRAMKDRLKCVGREMDINWETVRKHLAQHIEAKLQPVSLYDVMEKDIASGTPVHEAVNKILATWCGSMPANEKGHHKAVSLDRKRGGVLSMGSWV